MLMKAKLHPFYLGGILIIVLLHVFSVAAQKSDETSLANVQNGLTSDSHPTDSLASDSIRVNMLQNVVVTADKTWIEGNKIISIPSRKDKKLSNSPASLIEIMHFPGLTTKDETIQTLDGKAVAVFINGVRASDIDVATFYSSNANRVEYIVNSSDPRFEGEPYVVNLIMTEYEIGGVTRFSAMQAFPLDGSFRVASKCTYKQMTFGATAHYYYSDSKNVLDDASQTAVYRNFYYDNTYYDEVVNESLQHCKNDDSQSEAAANARWDSKKGYIIATAGFNWRGRIPGSRTESSEIWTPDILSSTSFSSHEKRVSLTPMAKLNAFFTLSDKFTIQGSGVYRHSHMNSSSRFQYYPLPEIKNDITEDSNSLSFFIQPTYKLNPYIWFSLSASTNQEWFRTRYVSDTESLQDQKNNLSSIYAGIYWNPSDKLSLSVFPGVRMNAWKIADMKWNVEYSPMIQLNLNWQIASKHSISGSSFYYIPAAKPSQMGDVIVRESEIMWKEGNVDLNPSPEFNISLSYTWLPSRMFQIGATGRWNRKTSSIIKSYLPAPEEMGGLIRSYHNGKSIDDAFAILSFTGLFFDGNLSISASPNLSYGKIHGDYGWTKTSYGISGNISYTLKNFNFGASGDIMSKYPMTHIQSICSDSGRYNFYFSWGNGNWYVSASLQNIFSKKRTFESIYKSEFYEYRKISDSQGRDISLSVTYTFDYGKKTNRNIQIDGVGSIQSSVID